MKNIFKSLAIALIWLPFLMAIAPAPAKSEDIPFFSIYPRISKGTWYLSNGWAGGPHQSCEWRESAITGQENLLQLKLSNYGGRIRPIGCAEIRTHKKYGYGIYEARIKSAAGSGLNTAFFTYTGPPKGGPIHDEIDFEFLGKNPHTVQVGYWHKSVQYAVKSIDLDFDASKEFHDYKFEWHPDKIIWSIDNKIIHQTSTTDPIPNNPGWLFLSLWSGSPKIDEWLGHFKYDSPKIALVEWTKFSPLSQEGKHGQ